MSVFTQSCLADMLYQGQNGILTRYDFPGGFFSLYDDENELPQLHPYAYITDHLGSVRMTVDGNGSYSGTENARQGMEYLPSGAIFSVTNYGAQPYKFCGKELLTMHGWDMYDSFARYQYALLPLTQREKMQNFPLNKIQLILADYYR